MAINLGTGAIDKLYLGSTEITKAYLGSTEVYSSGPPVINDAFELTVYVSAETFVLPLRGVTSVDIDWGDGTVDTGITSDDPSHTYVSGGSYAISVTGSATTIAFDGVASSKPKLATVTNLGNLGYTTLVVAFRNCSNLTSFVAGDCNIASVTNLGQTFENCTRLVTADVSTLDTSSVTTLSRFGGGMFGNCTSLENLDIDGWDVTSLTVAGNFLNGANLALTTAQYDAVLIAWAAQAVQSSVAINFGDATYTAGGAAEAARTSLITGDGWTIIDGGSV